MKKKEKSEQNVKIAKFLRNKIWTKL